MKLEQKLEQLPSGSYRVRKTANGKTYRVTFDHKPTDREALIALAEVMQEEAPREKGTFGTYAERYIESKRNILSPASVRTYYGLIDRISDRLKNTNLYDITQELSRSRSTSTQKTMLQSLLGAFTDSLHLYLVCIALNLCSKRLFLAKKVPNPINQPLRMLKPY